MFLQKRHRLLPTPRLKYHSNKWQQLYQVDAPSAANPDYWDFIYISVYTETFYSQQHIICFCVLW